MWLLEADGRFARVDEVDAGQEIPGEAPPAAPPDTPAVTVRFTVTADGRGFSAAERLRAMGYPGRLVAAGPLMPDQARHAFQCGFDAILVDDPSVARHGEEAWRNAPRRAVGDLYAARGTSRAGERGLWAARHAARARRG